MLRFRRCDRCRGTTSRPKLCGLCEALLDLTMEGDAPVVEVDEAARKLGTSRFGLVTAVAQRSDRLNLGRKPLVDARGSHIATALSEVDAGKLRISEPVVAKARAIVAKAAVASTEPKRHDGHIRHLAPGEVRRCEITCKSCHRTVGLERTSGPVQGRPPQLCPACKSLGGEASAWTETYCSG